MDIHLLDEFSQFCVEVTVRFSSLASIVQALLINSLNALADYVEVWRDGTNIEIRDNGYGISPSVLKKMRDEMGSSTLSKLKRISDLKIITFTREFGCWKAIYSENTVAKAHSMKKPGTIIRLENIFRGIPARASQFINESVLASVQAIEPLLYLTQSLTLKLFCNQNLYCEYRKVESLKERLRNVTKISKFQHVKYVGKAIDIEGYITNLEYCVFHGNYQYLYNEFQPVYSQEISDRINELYNKCIVARFPENSKEFIMKQNPAYPVYVLFMALPEGSYWINYQPYRTVELANSFEVLREITNMLKEQIFKDTITSKVCEKYLEKTVKKRKRAEFIAPQCFSFNGKIDDLSLLRLLDENKENLSPEDFTSQKLPNENVLIEAEESFKTMKKPIKPTISDFTDEILNTVRVSLTPLLPKSLKQFHPPKEISIKKSQKLLYSDSSFSIKNLKFSTIISQVDKKFILCLLDINSRQIIAALDQHASHERIKLEEIERKLPQHLESEECMIPLQVSNYEKSVLLQQSKRLEKWKFKITAIGDALALTQVPKLFGKVLGQPELLLSAHTQSLIPNPILTIMKSKACRSSIKFGDEITVEECEKICKDLENCALPTQCAHGRPTVYPLMELPPYISELPPINFSL
ncbi:unnamed protein product [Blepharisma stoltei]|uniref:MutL C-terminal dimerisation domain-containing protein n=1 Tax=Blepharisma stoltei TaxID=1481888 RepID=A0AAU9JSJ6_9CILI|nr:unnamed protein product [Blepharisma stoltei]